MKKSLLVLAAVVCLWPAAQVSQGGEVGVDFFYSNLSGGSWIEVGDYGYCWQPDVAVSDTSWRPYSDGYWAYTDLGWTWVSYEDFGWATYHYGRWARLSDHGWIWVPGRNSDLVWGPAWVSWRTGGEYIGWAPLPPETTGIVYEGRPVGGRVDIEFGIGPSAYNFVDVRYIGAPVLRERIVSVNQNVTYINQTVNVTNITYRNNAVYNYGPDFNVVNQHATQPVQRLKLERQENVDMAAAIKSNALVKPEGEKLVIGAPMRITKATQTSAPPNVKTKVAKANLDKGWGIVSDPNTRTQLQQKMKTEDIKQAQIGAGSGAAAGGQNNNAAGAKAKVNAVATTSVPPTWHGKGKNPSESAQTNVNSNVTSSATIAPNARVKAKNASQTKLPVETNANAATDVNLNNGASVPPTDIAGSKSKHNKNMPAGAQWKQNTNAELNGPAASLPPNETGVQDTGKLSKQKGRDIESSEKAGGNWPNKPTVDEGTAPGAVTGAGQGRKFPAGEQQLGNAPNTIGNGAGTNVLSDKHNKAPKLAPATAGGSGVGAGPQLDKGAGKVKEPKGGKALPSATP